MPAEAPTSAAVRVNPTARKDPPSDALQRIARMSKTGWSKKGMSLHFGLTVDTFSRWLNDYPELQAAFDNGREEEHNSLFNALFTAATVKGNAAAAMFLLKARHGYREGDQSDIANRVSITFSLPGADKLEAVVKKQKVIDHD